MTTGFRCATFGEWHDELPMDLGCAEPDCLLALSDEERAAQVTRAGDFRIWRDGDETHYFVRGVIEIPVADADDVFCYGVWASLSRASYEAARAAYDANGLAGPFFGWLCNRLSPYRPADTLNLKTHVHVRPDAKPAIVLEPTDHPLAVEQRTGITLARVRQIVEPFLHAE